MREEPKVFYGVDVNRVKHITSTSANKCLPDEHLSSPKGNISNCKIKCKDAIDNNAFTSAKNLSLKNHSLKRKFKDIDTNSCEKVINGVDSHRSNMEKFNIYTGYTCDFARKILEDLVETAPSKDK